MHGPSRIAHPLATELVETSTGGRFLLVGIGNGRNLLPFSAAELQGIAIDVDPARIPAAAQSNARIECKAASYAALPVADASIELVLSTHALQHGTRAEILAMLAEIARVSTANARFYGVFASRNDERYGRGRCIEAHCYAPIDGDEIGVSHYYFDAAEIRSVLSDTFEITSLDEVFADRIAGAWAHAQPNGLRHYFCKARRLGS